MSTRHHRARCLALTTLLFSSAWPTDAQDTLPRASVGAEAVTFGAPVGMWRPDTHSVSILYTTGALSPQDEAGARRDGTWPVEGLGPMAKVGAKPIEISGSAKDCHLISTGGRLLPGGMVIGLLDGKGAGYALRLPFTAMFPATTTTAAAAGPATPAATTAPAAAALPPIAPATSGPAGITHCYVNLDFPKGGPMGLNVNEAQRCGLTELSGAIRAGGNVVARLAGKAPMRDDQPMTWSLQFNLPIAK